MNRQLVTSIQTRLGTEPDGFWGPKSIAACQKHLRAIMPKINPWPAQDQSSLTAFYGKPGDGSKLVNLHVEKLFIKYEGKTCATILFHEKVADSLLRVLSRIAAGTDAHVLSEYAGCYNFRAMRGGYTPSLHARGAAIDLDPDPNGNLMPWPVVATMPLTVMEEFAREGWLAAGAFWSRDAMHFQATR